MALSATISAIISAIVSGAISYVVSRKVTKEKMETRIKLENEQRLNEWYERSVELARRTNDNWVDMMVGARKDYNMDIKDTFLNRHEELREHAARGEALGADKEVIQQLQKAARSLWDTVYQYDGGRSVSDIETNSPIPTLESIEETCNQKESVLDK